MDRLAQLQPPPLFVDVTWTLAAGKRALETLVAAKAVCGLDVQMHLSCTDLTRDMAEAVLSDAAQAGIRGLMILRGDPPADRDGEWLPIDDGFRNPGELVSFVRQHHGDHFSITVAGHPAGHPAHSAASQEAQIEYLRAKVDCGADMVVTQAVFSTAEYADFVAACRAAGITCPIVPGVLCVPPAREQLERVLAHCGVAPPAALLQALDADAAAHAAAGGTGRAVGAQTSELMAELCQGLLDGGAPGLYLFTLNLERAVTDLIPRLRFTPGPPAPTPAGDAPGGAAGPQCILRALPWHRPRYKETVRPIFWASNPLSYLSRTHRAPVPPDPAAPPPPVTGPAPVPAVGAPDNSRGGAGEEGTLYSHHSLVGRRLGSKAERRCMWGEAPTCEEDVFDVFERFVKGRVPRLPWCDRIEDETYASGLLKPLSALNHFGFLTINSQPRLDGLASEDPSFGWGPPGGRVYQKAYLEFFCSPSHLERLVQALAAHPSITLQAFDCTGRRRSVLSGGRGNSTAGGGEGGHAVSPRGAAGEERHVAAVTWGVFDSVEVLQPTVVDSAWFQVWSEEAFALWDSAWAAIYDPGTEARAVMERMMKSYWHVYMVDNDFVQGDILRVFAQILGVDPSAGSPVIRPRSGPRPQ